MNQNVNFVVFFAKSFPDFDAYCTLTMMSLAQCLLYMALWDYIVEVYF
jgi:hypothetical protein